jgi:hypothetical protein
VQAASGAAVLDIELDHYIMEMDAWKILVVLVGGNMWCFCFISIFISG